MKIDSLYILYENNNKLFNTYSEAYYNGKSYGSRLVYYIFTPTFAKFKTTRELYKYAKDYFRKNYDCDYLDPFSKTQYKQLCLC